MKNVSFARFLAACLLVSGSLAGTNVNLTHKYTFTSSGDYSFDSANMTVGSAEASLKTTGGDSTLKTNLAAYW